MFHLHVTALVIFVELQMQDPFSGLESTLDAPNEDCLGSSEQLVQRLNKEDEVIGVIKR